MKTDSNAKVAKKAADRSQVEVPASDVAAQRIVSVDALRGFDMFWIIGGSIVIQATARASGHPWLTWLLDTDGSRRVGGVPFH